jgi:hypothetical protein
MPLRILPLALALWLAPPAAFAGSEGAAPDVVAAGAKAPQAGDDARAWRGRYCTPDGCRGPAPASPAGAAGFAAAAFGAMRLARRTRAG